MADKLQLCVLCGGQSTEHDISLLSAKNVITALNPSKYHLTIVYITPQGQWYVLDEVQPFLVHNRPAELLQYGRAERVTLVLGDSEQPLQSLNNPDKRYAVECIFPMLHGTRGEDGTLQGLLDLLNVPYVGASTQSSALCMQKDITKQLLRNAGLPTLDWITLHASDCVHDCYDQLVAKFGPHMFVKPASLGSSIATVAVDSQSTFVAAVKHALRYDERVMVEPRVYGREIECAVLGNTNPQVALPGEIVVHHDFYSYTAKYLDPDGASTQAPANLTPAVATNIQQAALQAFGTLHCAGMARVDFFLVNDKDIYINEINTLPGFTNISMYPLMWQASGLSYCDLLDRLIELALERHRHQQSLIRIYCP